MPAMASRTNHTKPKSNPISILFIPVIFCLGLGAGYLLREYTSPPQGGSATPGSRRVTVSPGNSPSIGPKNAPITIIEFGDYQCPYCKLWHEQVYDRLLASYPGKILFVFRDFPLNGHPEAEPAAEAADCAGEQNAYWSYHDALFGQQYGLGRDAYLQYAAGLKLNIPTFTECLDSHRNQAAVQDNLTYGIGLGVQSTPSFFINGIPLIGAEPYESFQQIIDQELAGKKQ